MTRGERRCRTARKIEKRERLKDAFGLRGGTLYERHQEKVGKSLGYMRDGNVTHFVRCGFGTKTRGRNTSRNGAFKGHYGKAMNYMPHDERQIVDGEQQRRENNG